MSSTERLLLVGGGEHARVIADAVRARGHIDILAGYVDDATHDEMMRRFGLSRLGTDADVSRALSLTAILAFGGVHAAERRRAAAERLADRVMGWAVVTHPSAVLAADVQVGGGSVIFAGSLVNTGARIGPHCIINTGAIIEHDVVLGEQVQVAPGAVLGGGVRVGAGAYIGLGARVRDHVEIGDGAIVGMGAVVVQNVAPGTTVVGVPAG